MGKTELLRGRVCIGKMPDGRSLNKYVTAAIEEETDAMVELQVASACETLGDLVDAVEEEL